MDNDAKIQNYRKELELARRHRYHEGAKEYGAMAFTLRSGIKEDVKEEIADAMNWLEMLYLKVCMMETGEL